MVVVNIVHRNRFVATFRHDSHTSAEAVDPIRQFHRLVYPNLRIQNIRTGLKRSYSMSLLIINLGITWIMFLLYIGEQTQYFAYLFIIFNGSQVSPPPTPAILNQPSSRVYFF